MKGEVGMSKVIEIYCDGGCRGNQTKENVGGWGVYMKCGDFVKELKGGTKDTTNNIMELTATIEGLKAIKDKSATVKVYLDSAYTLNGITSWIKGWKDKGWKTVNKQPVKNQSLWMELDSVKSQFEDIEFIKVKGHADNEGNNHADRLANEAMDNLN